MADNGTILFFSSTLTIANNLKPTYLLYVAAKGNRKVEISMSPGLTFAYQGATEQVVRTLAKDDSLVSRGITTVAIAPGETDTDMFVEGEDDATLQAMKQMNPFKGHGTPNDIANVVDSIFCAGNWLNGSIIRASGGEAV